MSKLIRDVVVVGGGAAALSAALVLARARLSVEIVDSGAPRNRFAANVHGYLAAEGTPPLELTAKGRAEVASYGAVFREDTVADISGQLGEFEVHLESGETISTRRIVVATGLTDRLPEIAGVDDLWGEGIIHCPFCHGWEVKDQRVAVIGSSEFSSHQAIMLRNWTGAIEFLEQPGLELNPAARESLAALDIAIRPYPIDSVRKTESGIRFTGPHGELDFDAAMMASWPVANDTLLRKLGCALKPAGLVGSDTVAVDGFGETSVPGVYAAGNVTDLMALVVVAAAQGSATGVAVVKAVIDERLTAALARDRA